MSRVSDLEAALEMERRIAADNLAAYDAAIARAHQLGVALEAAQKATMDALVAGMSAVTEQEAAEAREQRLRAALQRIHDAHADYGADCICGVALATEADDA